MKIPQLEVQMQLPRLEMEARLPRLSIDGRQARADIGLKPIDQVVREHAARGRQAALKAIAQTAREGDELARIELGGNPIAEQARRRGLRDAQLNVDVAPKHRVMIDVEPGEVAFRFIEGQVRIRGAIHLAAGQYIDLKA